MNRIFPIGITLDLNHFLDLVVDQRWYWILSIYSPSVVIWWLNFILVIRRVDNAGTNWCKSRSDIVTISRRLQHILKLITVCKSLLCTTTFAALFSIRIIKKFVNILGTVEAPWSTHTGLTFKFDDWSVNSFISTKWLKQGLWIMLVRVGYDI